jgi:hypothetical protein
MKHEVRVGVSDLVIVLLQGDSQQPDHQPACRAHITKGGEPTDRLSGSQQRITSAAVRLQDR